MTRSSLRSIDRQVTLGFAVGLAIIISVMAYARARVISADQATEWVDHTHQVLEAIAGVRTQIAEARAGQRDYLLTGQPARLAPLRGASPGVDSLLAQLHALTGDNLPQQQRVDTLQALSRRLLADLSRLPALADSRGRGMARDAVTEGDSLAGQFQAVDARMVAHEHALLGERTARQVSERRAARAAVAFGALVILLLAAGAAFRVRSAMEVRERAESERDAHAEALALQSREVEAQNQELVAQGEALKHAMELAEGANRAKSMFLAQMSHELRTPLNSVIGFANIVRRNPREALNAAELTYLDRIAENGRQLLRTIDSILDLSKIEAEQENVELEMVAVDVLVREVLAQLEPQAVAAQVSVAAELPAPLASIVSDTEKLRRVLINLLANALKFTRPGGRVVVRVETASRAPTVPVAIEVRDTGVGIAPERLALIFEAFEQGDVGVGREYGGTGLGLSISRALCRLLHCDLTVSSVLDHGSAFRIALPPAGALASLPPVLPAPRSDASTRA